MAVTQFQNFILFLLVGVIIGVIFDLFRVFRKVVQNQKNIYIYIQDVLFWIIAGGIVIYSGVIINDGEFRIYILIAMALGCAIYLYTISKYFIKINVIIFSKVFHIIKVLIYTITKPCKFLVINSKKLFCQKKKKT